MVLSFLLLLFWLFWFFQSAQIKYWVKYAVLRRVFFESVHLFVRGYKFEAYIFVMVSLLEMDATECKSIMSHSTPMPIFVLIMKFKMILLFSFSTHCFVSHEIYGTLLNEWHELSFGVRILYSHGMHAKWWKIKLNWEEKDQNSFLIILREYHIYKERNRERENVWG